MPNKVTWGLAGAVILFLMFFCNNKVRIFSIIMKQFQVYRNAKKNKISVWDIFCFVIMPIVLATIITIGLEYNIGDTLAGVLATVFTFVFTVLFGFATIIVGKLDSEKEIEKQVVSETITSILTTNIISLFAVALSIAILMTKNELADCILSIIVFSFSFMVMMLLLMISKRTFKIYDDNMK